VPVIGFVHLGSADTVKTRSSLVLSPASRGRAATRPASILSPWRRLALLHELVPKAVRVAVLVNPANATAETTLQDVQEAARAIGLQIHVLNASTSREIDGAFATLVRERSDALLVAGDGFFTSRRAQFVPLRRATEFRQHMQMLIMSQPAD
jgi:putative tryptophan/tyrosine transport system substrate-binding protein